MSGSFNVDGHIKGLEIELLMHFYFETVHILSKFQGSRNILREIFHSATCRYSLIDLDNRMFFFFIQGFFFIFINPKWMCEGQTFRGVKENEI